MVGVDVADHEYHQQTAAGPFWASGLNVESPVRKKMRLKPASGRLREWEAVPNDLRRKAKVIGHESRRGVRVRDIERHGHAVISIPV